MIFRTYVAITLLEVAAVVSIPGDSDFTVTVNGAGKAT